MQVYILHHRDGTTVILCKEHLSEVIEAEQETIGKVEESQGYCYMCEQICIYKQNNRSLENISKK